MASSQCRYSKASTMHGGAIICLGGTHCTCMMRCILSAADDLVTISLSPVALSPPMSVCCCFSIVAALLFSLSARSAAALHASSAPADHMLHCSLRLCQLSGACLPSFAIVRHWRTQFCQHMMHHREHTCFCVFTNCFCSSCLPKFLPPLFWRHSVINPFGQRSIAS